MQDEIAKRVHVVLNAKGYTPNKITTMSGITTAARQLNGSVVLSVSLLTFVLDLFPDISAEWVMRGIGDMYVKKEPSTPLINNDIDVEGDFRDNSSINTGSSQSLESEVKFLRQLVQQLTAK